VYQTAAIAEKASRQGDRGQEEGADPLAENKPGHARHDHRRQIGQDGRLGHGGQGDPVVPEGQVQREGGPGEPEHPSRRTNASAFPPRKQRQKGQGEEHAPEPDRGGPGVCQAHEDGGEADDAGASDENDHGGAAFRTAALSDLLQGQAPR
jgi:hypothetical protein